MDTVNCCFAWFPWNGNVSQICHKQLNKFDWSKIQLVVWQSNHRHLKFCLPGFLFQLLVECLFVMDYLLFSFYLSLIVEGDLMAAVTTADVVVHDSGWCCPMHLFWAVSWWQCCLKGGHAPDCLASQSFGSHQVAEVRPVQCITLDHCCCCHIFQKHDNRNLR